MDTMHCWFTTEGGESWQTYQDVVNSFGSIATLSGERNKTDEAQLLSSIIKKADLTQDSDSSENVKEDKYVDPYDPKQKIDVVARDAALHSELRTACGAGFSNELIEQHWRYDSKLYSSDRQGGEPLEQDYRPPPLSSASPVVSRPEQERNYFKYNAREVLPHFDDLGSDISFRKAPAKYDKESVPSDLLPKEPSFRSVGWKGRPHKIFRCRNALLLGLHRSGVTAAMAPYGYDKDEEVAEEEDKIEENSTELESDLDDSTISLSTSSTEVTGSIDNRRKTDDYVPDFFHMDFTPLPLFHVCSEDEYVSYKPTYALAMSSDSDFKLSDDDFPPL